MPITALPTPPSREDSANFAQRADEFLGALPAFAAEANAMGAEVNANAAICQSAAMVVSVTAWASGTTYAVGVVVYDPVDFLTYRRKVAGAGTTRPGLDATNWQLLTGFGNVTLDTAQTITGTKTFSQPIVGSVTGSAGSVSTSVALAAIAGAAVGAVGSTALLKLNIASAATPGTTVAGSSLFYVSAAGTASGSPSGTWRAMGYANGSAGGADAVTLWLRIV